MKKLIVKKGGVTEKAQATTKDAQSIESYRKKEKTKEYIALRNAERGSVESQLEYIVENGIDAFIKRDKEIRKKYPKK